ncbi:hypothetical protein DUNSADRAFT_6297 [Dunaliella salina]|uniref:Secreted protein n=1 Tax=Dunaliella salina TaxID=3046 RepID=A0ABQ7GNM8_DUNSA|nr:hypothetical protein DUNSADRAFT_6297 [Dunaliella salina]|eukprot:KAF5836188.1 hypothetical protein DUNSADRAFT_6297 [Dunaliella salina]
MGCLAAPHCNPMGAWPFACLLFFPCRTCRKVGCLAAPALSHLPENGMPCRTCLATPAAKWDTSSPTALPHLPVAHGFPCRTSRQMGHLVTFLRHKVPCCTCQHRQLKLNKACNQTRQV